MKENRIIVIQDIVEHNLKQASRRKDELEKSIQAKMQDEQFIDIDTYNAYVCEITQWKRLNSSLNMWIADGVLTEDNLADKLQGFSIEVLATDRQLGMSDKLASQWYSIKIDFFNNLKNIINHLSTDKK